MGGMLYFWHNAQILMALHRQFDEAGCSKAEHHKFS